MKLSYAERFRAHSLGDVNSLEARGRVILKEGDRILIRDFCRLELEKQRIKAKSLILGMYLCACTRKLLHFTKAYFALRSNPTHELCRRRKRVLSLCVSKVSNHSTTLPIGIPDPSRRESPKVQEHRLIKIKGFHNAVLTAIFIIDVGGVWCSPMNVLGHVILHGRDHLLRSDSSSFAHTFFPRFKLTWLKSGTHLSLDGRIVRMLKAD